MLSCPSPAQAPILVVSAFAPELAPLRRALKRASVSKTQIACVPVGIGVVDAAVGAARAIERFGPRLVLFVGTAGAYGATPPIGGVAIPRRLVLASTAVARAEGYLPAPVVVEASTDARVRRALQRFAATGGVVADVATTIAITRSASLARRLSAVTGTSVENLEIFAVARAAQAAGVRFGAVLGISNRVGPRAHAEWRRYQTAATSAAATVVATFLVAEFTAPSRSTAGLQLSPLARRRRRE
jgi:nucleoside phosphorylase